MNIKRTSKKLIAFFLFFGLIAIGQTFAQKTYWSKAFADAIMKRHTDINNLTRKGWEYSNSIVLIGIEKLYYETGETKYLDYIKKYVDNYIDDVGNVSFNADDNNLDHLHPAWLCITLYEETGLEKYKLAAATIRAEFDNQPRTPSGGFWHKQRYQNQMWADGLYMAEPFLIRYGSVFGDEIYTQNEATEQVALMAEHAMDTTKHLLVHGWDESKTASWADPVTGLSSEVWSRGLGWYCMALVDILDFLPTDHANYNRMIEILQELALGLKTYQDASTGLWHQVVDKGGVTGNWLETSGSAMFVYSLKKAINNGYIDSANYTPVVAKGWEGLQTKISLDNVGRPVINEFVGAMGIQNSYNNYVSQSRVSTPSSNNSHGYCGILLASHIMETPLPKFYTFTATKSTGGRITKSTNETDFVVGRELTITATPYTGYHFTGWTGDIQSADSLLTITMNSTISIKANFEKTVVSTPSIEQDKCKVYWATRNSLIVELPRNGGLVQGQIIDAQGKATGHKLSFNTNVEALFELNLGGLPSGIYNLVIQTVTGKNNLRFIKI